jgi:hypothetical protein
MENQATMRHIVNSPEYHNVARSADEYGKDSSPINSHRDILVMVFSKCNPADNLSVAPNRTIEGRLVFKANGQPESYQALPTKYLSPKHQGQHYAVTCFGEYLRLKDTPEGMAEEVRQVLTTFVVQVCP